MPAGPFKDSWAAAKMAELMGAKRKPMYRVLRVVKDWEAGSVRHGGETIQLTGAETHPFCASCGGLRRTGVSNESRREG